MIELKHLRTIQALAKHGSMKHAAENLFISLSALSHQIKELESRIGDQLFIRGTTPLQFSQAGLEILALADKVLPEVQATQSKLTAVIHHSLTIGLACHACFQWLIPAIDSCKLTYPHYDIDFVEDVFDEDNNVDILFTDELLTENNIQGMKDTYLGEFELVLVTSTQHHLSSHRFIVGQDISPETLLTYPVPEEKLDVFKTLLTPYSIKPNKVRHIKNSHTMIQMASAGLGVAVLPYWLVTSYHQQNLVSLKRLNERGLYSKMYARYSKNMHNSKVVLHLINQAKHHFNDLTLTQKS